MTELHVQKSLELIRTIQDLEIYCSYSGGKDSTALIALLLKSNMPFSVIHSNTLMEMPYINELVDSMQTLIGDRFHKLVAPMNERFFYNLIGRGVAVPNRTFRWCTDKLKIRPMKKFMAEKTNYIMLTGERLGESKARDLKLASACGSNGECGLKETAKTFDNAILRPIMNWTTCQVWDFIALSDIDGTLPSGTFNKLAKIQNH